MQKHYNSKVVNLIKLVYIPMTINIVVIIGIVIFSIYFNSKILQKQYKEEGILLATQIGDQLARNINSQNYAESILENKIRIAASTILEIKKNNSISDEWLIKMLEILDVSEIHYLDKNGKIIFSTIEGYLGWTPNKGHPLYNFVRSNNIELMEEIRPDDKYKKLIKYGSIKGNDGSFVQVGIEAKIVEFTKSQFNYQTIIDDISKYEGKLYGILNITYTLESLNEINYSAIMLYIFLLLVILSNLIWFQHTNIIVPVYELEKSINKIDVTRDTNYKIPEQTNGTFSGLVYIINKILDNTYEFIYKLSEALEEIELSNEELSVAYNQIQASEELLKTQYNEIKEQKNT